MVINLFLTNWHDPPSTDLQLLVHVLMDAMGIELIIDGSQHQRGTVDVERKGWQPFGLSSTIFSHAFFNICSMHVLIQN